MRNKNKASHVWPDFGVRYSSLFYDSTLVMISAPRPLETPAVKSVPVNLDLTQADVDAIARIALERAALLRRLKAALVNGDTLGAL